MSTQYTTNVGLGYWQLNDPGWHLPFQADMLLLDGLSPIGNLAVNFAEIPSASLDIRVAAGSYRSSTGQVVSYAGVVPYAVPASATTYLWLTDAGVLASGSGWPATAHVRLAVITSGATTITSILDARVTYQSVGSGSRVAVRLVTTTASISPTDGLIKADATSAAFSVALPDASTVPGMVVRVMKVDASSNAVTIGVSFGQTVNGVASISLAAQWQAKTLISDGSNWVAF